MLARVCLQLMHALSVRFKFYVFPRHRPSATDRDTRVFLCLLVFVFVAEQPKEKEGKEKDPKPGPPVSYIHACRVYTVCNILAC